MEVILGITLIWLFVMEVLEYRHDGRMIRILEKWGYT